MIIRKCDIICTGSGDCWIKRHYQFYLSCYLWFHFAVPLSASGIASKKLKQSAMKNARIGLVSTACRYTLNLPTPTFVTMIIVWTTATRCHKSTPVIPGCEVYLLMFEPLSICTFLPDTAWIITTNPHKLHQQLDYASFFISLNTYTCMLIKVWLDVSCFFPWWLVISKSYRSLLSMLRVNPLSDPSAFGSRWAVIILHQCPKVSSVFWQPTNLPIFEWFLCVILRMMNLLVENLI